MFGTTTLVLGLQLLALTHGATLVKDVQPAAGRACGPVDIVCIIRELLDGLRDHPAINPVKFNDIDQNYRYGYSRWRVALTDAILEGVPAFDLENLQYNVINGKVDLTLVFPSLVVSAPTYVIRGTINDVAIFHGEGPLVTSLVNVKIVGSAMVKTQVFPPGILGVENVICDVTAEDFTFEMGNFLGENSDWFNQLVTDNGLLVLSHFKEQIDTMLATSLERILNNLITGGSLNDALKMDAKSENILAGLTEKLMKHVEAEVKV